MASTSKGKHLPPSVGANFLSFLQLHIRGVMCGSIFSLTSLPRSGSDPITACRTGAAPPYSCHHPSTSAFPQSQLPCSPGLLASQPAVPDHTAASQHLLGLGAAKAAPLGSLSAGATGERWVARGPRGPGAAPGAPGARPPIAASGATAPGAGWGDWRGWPCWEEGFYKKH